MRRILLGLVLSLPFLFCSPTKSKADDMTCTSLHDGLSSLQEKNFKPVWTGSYGMVSKLSLFADDKGTWIEMLFIPKNDQACIVFIGKNSHQ